MSTINDIDDSFLRNEIIPKLDLINGFKLSLALGRRFVKDYLSENRSGIIAIDFIRPGDILTSTYAIGEQWIDSIPNDHYVRWVRVVKQTKNFMFVQYVEFEREKEPSGLFATTVMTTKPVFPIVVSEKKMQRLALTDRKPKNKAFVYEYKYSMFKYKWVRMSEKDKPISINVKNTNFGTYA